MQYEPWMDKATPNDMPNDDLKFVAEKAGMKQALMLIFLLPGLNVSIPKNALRIVKERHIINEYDGTRFTINRLAVECESVYSKSCSVILIDYVPFFYNSKCVFRDTDI